MFFKEKFLTEREKMSSGVEKGQKEIMDQKDNEIKKLTERVENLQSEVRKIKSDKDVAEAEKQKAEKEVAVLKREVETANKEATHMKEEAGIAKKIAEELKLVNTNGSMSASKPASRRSSSAAVDTASIAR